MQRLRVVVAARKDRDHQRTAAVAPSRTIILETKTALASSWNQATSLLLRLSLVLGLQGPSSRDHWRTDKVASVAIRAASGHTGRNVASNLCSVAGGVRLRSVSDLSRSTVPHGIQKSPEECAVTRANWAVTRVSTRPEPRNLTLHARLLKAQYPGEHASSGSSCAVAQASTREGPRKRSYKIILRFQSSAPILRLIRRPLFSAGA